MEEKIRRIIHHTASPQKRAPFWRRVSQTKTDGGVVVGEVAGKVVGKVVRHGKIEKVMPHIILEDSKGKYEYDISESVTLPSLNFASEKIEKVEKQIISLQKSLKRAEVKIDNLSSNLSVLSKEKLDLELKIAQSNFLDSLGLKLHEIEHSVTLPLRIYSTNEDAKEKVESILLKEEENKIFEVFGPDVKGSWYREIYYKLKGIDAEKYKYYVEKSAKLKILEKPQAEVDNLNADTILKTLEALKSLDEGTIQNGAILAVKYFDKKSKNIQVFTKVLTIDELSFIETNKILLRQPREILAQLDAIEVKEKPILLSKPPH